jgi:CRISPR type III-B/RAMP module-associated protein Cmr5
VSGAPTEATREQRRAKDAALQVEQAARDLKPKERKRFNSLAHALPVWLRTNGLLQAVVFLESKKRKDSDAEAALLDALGVQLQAAGLPRPQGALSGAFFDMPYAQYTRWQEEAVRGAAWLKRFSAARFGPPDPDEGDAAGTGDESKEG